MYFLSYSFFAHFLFLPFFFFTFFTTFCLFWFSLRGLLSGGTFDFHFCFPILNIFLLNGTKILYSEFFVQWGFYKSRFHCIEEYLDLKFSKH